MMSDNVEHPVTVATFSVGARPHQWLPLKTISTTSISLRSMGLNTHYKFYLD